MSADSHAAPAPTSPTAPHDCELEGCGRRAARGRRYCSITHLQIAAFRGEAA